ncbi:DUF3306 domain-containing protein [Marinobacter sp.]|uniref:DUF3306 domain-containing protein n=1 Tax=Marinobacter sp. TaxID=50741 RepID=UPI0034A51147
MAESRLQRWARKKTEVRQETDPAVSSPVEAEKNPEEPQLAIEEQELTVNEALPEEALLEKYHLPAPESIELGTDITGFMRKEIPEFLRRKALRALWRSNPVLAVLDGLNDYDEDFTSAATATTGVKTLYKVGQGLIDRSAKAEKEPADAEPTEAQPVEQTEATEKPGPDNAPEFLNRTQAPEPIETGAEPTHAETAPRYRPRMRFDY